MAKSLETIKTAYSKLANNVDMIAAYGILGGCGNFFGYVIGYIAGNEMGHRTCEAVGCGAYANFNAGSILESYTKTYGDIGSVIGTIALPLAVYIAVTHGPDIVDRLTKLHNCLRKK